MHQNYDNNIRSTRKYFFLFIFFIIIFLIALIFAGTKNQLILFIFIILFFIIGSFFFWQLNYFSEVKPSHQILLFKYILGRLLFSKNAFFAVRNGEINEDYILLQNKPKIEVINIDNRSAVIIEDKTGNRSLLLSGIHILKGNPKIIGTFYLGTRFFQVGPSDPTALSPKFVRESLAEYHARISSAEQTKTRLSSGEIIFPLFTVFYRLDISSQSYSDHEMLQTLNKISNLVKPSIFTSTDLEIFLTGILINSWQSYCDKKKKDEILTNFPGYFESDNIQIDGIVQQIYIDEIY